MQDRFKFRVYFKGSEYAEAGYEDLTRNDVIYSLRADGQIIRNVVYECQEEGREGEPCNLPFTPDNDLYCIQFCTGLKDKNGKLIYEGDVVNFNNDTYGICKASIEWDNARYQILYYTGGNYGWFSEILCLKHLEKIEIIGNIYENPELLEVEDVNI